MTTRVFTAQHDAMDATVLQVECTIAKGSVGVGLIGNVSEVCRNGLDRARTALERLNIELPAKRILINVSPAEMKKDGSYLDLPLAVALAHLLGGKAFHVNLEDWGFAAELSIDGILKPIKGAVPLCLALQGAKKKGMVVAYENFEAMQRLQSLRSKEGSFVILPFAHLADVLAWLCGEAAVQTLAPQGIKVGDLNDTGPNFDDMLLTDDLRLLAMACATGLHSLMLHGPPGTGKSMFAARLTSIFPLMSPETQVESLKIHSVLYETLPHLLLLGRPPYRAPHHQASAAAVIGIPEQPGEISLAHGGILFLDEFPEFRRDIIEALREPLETGHVRISRAQKKTECPSHITLVAAANACPCGWLGSRLRRCMCPANKILAYKRRISGPVLDRIDMVFHLQDGGVSPADTLLQAGAVGVGQSQLMRDKVLAAREFGAVRNEQLGIRLNRDIKTYQLVRVSGQEPEKFRRLIDQHTPRMASRRAILRAVRVARTLADLDSSFEIEPCHLKQAWKWLPLASGEEWI
jgi:magnesium chelatase family protein